MNNANRPEDNNRSVAARPRLLFVDDEPQILKALRWLFRREYDVHLAEGGPVSDEILTYLNRLSDLLFVFARLENHRSGGGDVEWQKP